eukprot:TRINITY_DN3870_c0_g1_i2.p1 TRINITY_DN3870_c0_g1~~TRINITY_DN3870_c0_g1_i2.p1  ORF type:complete len:264 (-),score=42.12 TRINITY_DN3870_c0_g1_i2:212-1003(-)
MSILFFFFKQKTAYEISACLVGSEMCIRDRVSTQSTWDTTTRETNNLNLSNNSNFLNNDMRPKTSNFSELKQEHIYIQNLENVKQLSLKDQAKTSILKRDAYQIQTPNAEIVKFLHPTLSDDYYQSYESRFESWTPGTLTQRQLPNSAQKKLPPVRYVLEKPYCNYKKIQRFKQEYEKQLEANYQKTYSTGIYKESNNSNQLTMKNQNSQNTNNLRDEEKFKELQYLPSDSKSKNQIFKSNKQFDPRKIKLAMSQKQQQALLS